jgi:hypothetical protein
MSILPPFQKLCLKPVDVAWRFANWRFMCASDDGLYISLKHPIGGEIIVLRGEDAVQWLRVHVEVFGPDALQPLSCINTNEVSSQESASWPQ